MNQVPKIIETLYTEKRWPELIAYFKAQWNKDAWAANKRNGNAVERIKREFTRLAKGKRPFNPGTSEKHWDEQIAKYIDRLGVAALINDMRDAFQKFPHIKSIIYFLHSSAGNCRWENLIYLQIEQDWQKEKELEAEQWKPFAEMLNFKNQREPEWVTQSKKDVETLKRKLNLPGINRREITGEIDRIKNKCHALGYNI